MNDTRSTLRYPGFRFPAEIIGHAVWLYHRFTLSFRDIEDLLAECGILVTHETIRQCNGVYALDRNTLIQSVGAGHNRATNGI
jgi:transposase-like protein